MTFYHVAFDKKYSGAHVHADGAFNRPSVFNGYAKGLGKQKSQWALERLTRSEIDARLAQ